jgi:hypothetical protein
MTELRMDLLDTPADPSLGLRVLREYILPTSQRGSGHPPSPLPRRNCPSVVFLSLSNSDSEWARMTQPLVRATRCTICGMGFIDEIDRYAPRGHIL